ncbi:MAG: hypothetical protein BIFFINMI_04021 [Phycisphaerae bacterium]|nr:hypothetical protein [Phycisphaerae bacterium]
MLHEHESAIEKVWDFCEEHSKDAWNVPRDGGRFLFATAIAVGARNILEIGTSYGFSGLHLAAAAKVNGGRLTTIDADPRKVKISGEHFRMAGLGGVVDQRCGPAQDVLGEVHGPFDMVFVDAVKEDSLAYFQAFRDKLADRAVILTDNLTTHDEARFGDYLPTIRNDPHMVSLTVPVGNGFEYTVWAR